MYLDYFGFDEPPFSITPDPHFVFLSKKHQESLAHLIYGMTRGGGAGFVQLTGEVGTGKTTISRLLLEKLPEKTNVALILNPSISPIELLENMCREFDIDTAGIDGQLNRLIDRLNDYLLESWSAGEHTAVIIDEAQNLPRDTLEQLRILTNLETDKQKLLQIILIGQPELRSTMRRNDLRQLAQRVTARYHLMPLSQDETYEYLQHRIKVAGGNDSIVNNSAARLIHRLTDGVPRLINTLTDRALLAAYSASSQKLAKQHINTAAAEVLPETHQTSISSHFNGKQLLGLIALMALAAIVFDHFTSEKPWSDELLKKVTVEPSDALIDERSSNQAAVEPLEVQTFRPATTQNAWHLYLNLWDTTSDRIWNKSECPESAEIAMSCLRRQGNFKQIAKLNHPVMLQLQDGTLVLLSGIDNGKIRLANHNQQYTWLDKSWIDDRWFGTYFILWPMPAKLLLDNNAEDLQKWSLEMANTIATESISSEQLNQWIITFQKDHGLLADGIIGPETQMALSLMAYSGPILKQ